MAAKEHCWPGRGSLRMCTVQCLVASALTSQAALCCCCCDLCTLLWCARWRCWCCCRPHMRPGALTGTGAGQRRAAGAHATGAGRAQGKKAGTEATGCVHGGNRHILSFDCAGARQPWSRMRATAAAAGGCALLAPAEVCGGCSGRASHTAASSSRLASPTWDFALRKACCHTRWETSAGSETSLLTQACSRQYSKRGCVGPCWTSATGRPGVTDQKTAGGAVGALRQGWLCCCSPRAGRSIPQPQLHRPLPSGRLLPGSGAEPAGSTPRGRPAWVCMAAAPCLPTMGSWDQGTRPAWEGQPGAGAPKKEHKLATRRVLLCPDGVLLYLAQSLNQDGLTLTVVSLGSGVAILAPHQPSPA